MPRVSVVVPVYNAQAYLAEAMDSILGQTFFDFEVIVIDDGSTDKSKEILEKYAADDTRVRLVSRENKGVTATLNEGISLSRGTYIARMDADDITLPDRFEKQVEFLDRHSDTVVVGGQVILIDPNGQILCEMDLPCTHAEIDGRHMGSIGSVIFHPATMIRANALRQCNGYDEKAEAAEDFDLWLRMAEIGKLANLETPVLLYRQHLQSVGYAKRRRQRLSTWQAIQSAAVRRGIEVDIPSPEDEPDESIHAIHRKWAWWALRGKNVGTARQHAFNATKCAPFNKENWRVLFCSLRGY